MTLNFKNVLSLIIIPVLFLIISLITLSDYGISWDEPIHFTRGQAYLHYFLTGNLDYQNFKPDNKPSLYQDTSFTGKFFLKNDSGHPPVNGILAALSNLIFYQKLAVLGDIEAYHLFNVLVSSLLVLVVVLFAAQAYGLLAAVVAGVSLALYPLFFAEAHFNIKDPAEAAFYAATIWAFWNSLKRYNLRWLGAAILFFTLALGTKFNVLFLPVIIVLWLLSRIDRAKLNPFNLAKKIPKKFLLVVFLSPVIISATFFLTWPYLWQDPLSNTFNIFMYYKDIGTGGLGQPQFLTPGSFNIFPTTWIIITTPPLILLLTVLGIIAVFRQKDQEKTALLWLIWLIIPILRVSMPGSSIYGGIRQIMEFIPAMALLSGLGADFILRRVKSKMIVITFIIVITIMLSWPLVKLHPNENVYFNFLIGGLKGAQQANIPYYGNSFGNAYYPAAKWINLNAPPGSKVGLLQGTSVNIPVSYFTSSTNYSNSVWSGITRQGEYLVELTHQGNEVAYPFAWEYVKRVLIPVYEVTVDDVPLAKVWKNDLEHSRAEYQKEISLPVRNTSSLNETLEITLDQVYSLAQLKVNFDTLGRCQPFKKGVIQTSVDGINWRTESEKLPDFQIKAYPPLEGGKLRYIFPANPAQYIKVVSDSQNSCLFHNFQVEVSGFKVGN